jgi:peptide/nickel transport system permease protein
MATYLIRRLLLMIPTVLGITLMVFLIVALAPGGIGAGLAVQGGQMSDTSKVAQMQAYMEDRYGLNDPVVVQYGRWIARVCPVRFGTTSLESPSGERIAVPRELPEPPMQWAFPAPAAFEVTFTPQTGDALVVEFRTLQRDAEGRRRNYVGLVRAFKDALADYVRVLGAPWTERLDPKGGADPQKFRDLPHRHSAAPKGAAAAWAKVNAAAAQMHQAWSLAEEARQRATIAFAARPFPPAGIEVIRDVVSIDSPDFGVAFSRNRPVWDLIKTALPVTMLINLIAFPIIYLVAVPTGVLASIRRGGVADIASGFLFLLLYSVPVVLAGVFAIGFLANNQYLGWFPVSGLHDSAEATMTFLPHTDSFGVWQRGWLLDTIWHLALPVLCLVYGGFAVLSKQTRASMLDNFNADYVRTARAKGVPRKDIVISHVLRNSLLPLITMFVGIFPAMLGGSVVVERIFTIPGMGSLVIEAINLRDRELILANTFMISSVSLLALLLADILYALCDPRVAYE